MKQAKKSGLKSMIILVFLLASMGMLCPGADAQARKFMATAGVNIFQSSSSGYREIYGQTAVMPELKVTCKIFKNFTVWGGFGLTSKQGFIEEVEEEAEIRQNFFSIGVGYAQKLSARLRLRGELGLAAITFKEEALGATLKGSGLGWKIGADLDYFIGKKLFVILAAAFSEASDEVETGKIKLGGLQAGIGLGFTF
jgi:hypothetical protein